MNCSYGKVLRTQEKKISTKKDAPDAAGASDKGGNKNYRVRDENDGGKIIV